MTWKSRRFRLTLAARWGGNNFLLGHTGWRRVFATSFGWQKANSDSAMVRKWFMEPFPAGISPLVCIFTWTKQTGVTTFFFNTLRHWVWDSFFFFLCSNQGWEVVLYSRFWGRSMPRKGWMHVMDMLSYQHRIQLCICTNEIFGLLSFIRPGPQGLCESHQGTSRYSLITSRSLLPCFIFFPPLFW